MAGEPPGNPHPATRLAWPEIYHSHTCYKALGRAIEISRQKSIGLIRLENQPPPCIMCKAWWRRCTVDFGIKVEIISPSGTWRSF